MLPRTKKPKLSKQKFKVSYSSEFPCIKASEISVNHAHCSVCNKDFSVAHGGKDDCKRHVFSQKHIELGTVKSKEITNFLIKDDETDPIKAECYFVRFLIEHNLPLSVSDHSKELFKAMFPDSAIAKKFSCGHTKTAAIVKTLAENTVADIIKSVCSTSFSLSTDGSNDNNDNKLYPLVITYYSKEKGVIITSLISILECTNNTGEGIFNCINENFKNKGLEWKNCLSFSSDNASNMIGKFKGVASFIKMHQPSIITRGCPCHLLHIAAKKATEKLIGSEIEMLIIDIYFYLEKSSKRKHSFKVAQQILGQNAKSHKILKYCSTRWLSLLESITRILEQWDAVINFFGDKPDNSENEGKRLQNIKKILQSPTTKLYLLFLKNTLPLFITVNINLQQQAPYIHKLRRELFELLMNLFVRFVKPSVISKENEDVTLTSIPFQKYSKQKENENLVIGAETRLYLKNAKLNESEVKSFFNSVRAFFVTACSYIIDKFPLSDPFLKHAEVADINLRTEVSFSSVLYLMNTFPSIIDEKCLNQVEIEFSMYQVDDLKEIVDLRIDIAWGEIAKLKNMNGCIKYKVLPSVMLAVLIIPHSNAACERIFSIVKKNQTEFRPNLGLKTLEAVLIEKINMQANEELCYKKTFSKSALKLAKHATYKSLHS